MFPVTVLACHWEWFETGNCKFKFKEFGGAKCCGSVNGTSRLCEKFGEQKWTDLKLGLFWKKCGS